MVFEMKYAIMILALLSFGALTACQTGSGGQTMKTSANAGGEGGGGGGGGGC